MSKVLLALTSVALLGLSGCADLYINKPAEKAPAAKAAAPTISAEAKAALDAAKAEAKDAKAKNALWTTADSAIKAAEEAAKKGDSETVLKEVAKAREHIKLGLAQMDYPLIRVGD